MAGRYRALLIGNSTYPADEHNLQPLKGPVKDIAVLNRALIDPGTGLFADVDVTLLPEATSARAIRALGRFFGAAARDDVLLVYFSGHGKLDQAGRLHLCMQDTESADLLSTAVSSARIKEFADASRARNVIIVLDCCYAGAFRGAGLGDAVAGPGRYVLTSCRGTQLANDATVQNGTSFFTQHLVDGLVDAAADQDGDGYVTFSDLYAYVDQRLRETGKQIPQRRVDGDGDVRLAKRPQPAPAQTAAAEPQPQLGGHADTAGTAAIGPGQPKGTPAGGPSPGPGDAGAGTAPADGSLRPAGARRKLLIAAAAIVAAGGIIAALVLAGGSSGSPNASGNFHASGHLITATAPWRLQIVDHILPSSSDNGCIITLTDTRSGARIPLPAGQYHASRLQIHQAGSFRWQVNDPAGCTVTAVAGSGSATLPFPFDQVGDGDSNAFAAPRVAVRLTGQRNGSCKIALYDPANGQQLDSVVPAKGTVTLDSRGSPTAYLRFHFCHAWVSVAR